MSNFEDLLKETLHGINDRFDVVDQDLHEVVAEAAIGVEKVTNGGARLYLEKGVDHPGGVNYNLYLKGSATTGTPVRLAGVTIPRTGYPIQVEGGSQLVDKDALRSYLAEMAKNPNSPLVVNLAYYLRHKHKTPA